MTQALEDIERLLEALPLAAMFIGRNERILGANTRAQGLIGREIVGRHFITAVRQPAVMDAIETCLAQHGTQTTRYLSNDGMQDTSYALHCAYIDFAGHAGVLVSFEDITHVEQAGQMRRDFVANVSHELRTPLTALLGFIETLQGPAKGDPAASERFLGTMHREATRMERLVRDLLSLSRVESEERMRPKEPQEVVGLMRSVAHTLRPLLEDANVAIEMDVPEDPVMVPGNADQLRQVFTNLIENAVKYGGPDRTVWVTIEMVQEERTIRRPGAVISVRDEGPGIDPLHIPRLTERFYRVDSHRSREMGGTGLGLAIVKHIVGRHRGRLKIMSDVGKGSIFRVIIPLYDRSLQNQDAQGA